MQVLSGADLPCHSLRRSGTELLCSTYTPPSNEGLSPVRPGLSVLLFLSLAVPYSVLISSGVRGVATRSPARGDTCIIPGTHSTCWRAGPRGYNG